MDADRQLPEPLWDGKPETRLSYWIGRKPPSLPPTLGTQIYSVNRLALCDFNPEVVYRQPAQSTAPCAVDHMTMWHLRTQQEEIEKYMERKLRNYMVVRNHYRNTPRYCQICTEHPSNEFNPDMPLQPVIHDHTSTLLRRIEQETDEYGRYHCLECSPRRAMHGVKQADRYLICVTSSCLNNWMTAGINQANPGFKGSSVHVDWEGVSGANIRGLQHAFSAVYGGSKRPVSVLVAAGSNDLIQGRSVDDIMRDLTRFKAMVLGIAPRHHTGPSNFAVTTPPHPPKFTKYELDRHQLGGPDLTENFLELTQRIVDFNLEGTRRWPGVAWAPMFHKMGVHMRITTVWDRYLMNQRYTLRKIPLNHRFRDWRERRPEHMLHLSERRRINMGEAVIKYFEKLHGLDK